MFAEAAGDGQRGQDPFSDLQGLLTEIQALRAQLERSIETSSTLQSRLEDQLAKAGKEAPEAALTGALHPGALHPGPSPEPPLQLGKHGTAPASPPCLRMQP